MNKFISGFAKIRKWSKKRNEFNEFSKRFLVIPIVKSWHWSLAIVCNPAAVLQTVSGETKIGKCVVQLGGYFLCADIGVCV